MKILVTGASGKLGRVTVNRLLAEGYEVTGVDLVGSETTHKIVDIRNENSVYELTKGFNAIIHTAALHGRHMDLNLSRAAFIETNINGTLNLLNACVKNGIAKFLFTSTTSIYGNAMVNEAQAVWVDENLTIQPRDIYDITKQTCEALCRDFFEKENIMTSVYRVGRFLPEDDNLMLNHRLYRGLDERDGAEALKLAVVRHFDEFEIFNISSGSPFSKDDLIELKHQPEKVIASYLPEAIEIYKRKHWKFPESIDRVYASAKATRLLGYRPKYTFDFLLQQFREPVN